MAITLHKDLTDANLHAPKGFVGAATGTYPVKTSTNKLRWGGVERIRVGGYCRMTSDNHYFPDKLHGGTWNDWDNTNDSATLASLTPLECIAASQLVPHAACYITKCVIWARGTSGETANIRLWKGATTFTNNNSTAINLTKIGSDGALAPDSDDKSYKVTITGDSTSIAADTPIILTCSGYASSTAQYIYMNGYIEVVYTA